MELFYPLKVIFGNQILPYSSRILSSVLWKTTFFNYKSLNIWASGNPQFKETPAPPSPKQNLEIPHLEINIFIPDFLIYMYQYA